MCGTFWGDSVFSPYGLKWFYVILKRRFAAFATGTTAPPILPFLWKSSTNPKSRVVPVWEDFPSLFAGSTKVQPFISPCERFFAPLFLLESNGTTLKMHFFSAFFSLCRNESSDLALKLSAPFGQECDKLCCRSRNMHRCANRQNSFYKESAFPYKMILWHLFPSLWLTSVTKPFFRLFNQILRVIFVQVA